jgi:hypothetical protein
MNKCDLHAIIHAICLSALLYGTKWFFPKQAVAWGVLHALVVRIITALIAYNYTDFCE